MSLLEDPLPPAQMQSCLTFWHHWEPFLIQLPAVVSSFFYKPILCPPEPLFRGESLYLLRLLLLLCLCFTESGVNMEVGLTSFRSGFFGELFSLSCSLI